MSPIKGSDDDEALITSASLKAHLLASYTDRAAMRAEITAWNTKLSTVHHVMAVVTVRLDRIKEEMRSHTAQLLEHHSTMSATQLADLKKRLISLQVRCDDCEIDLAEWTQWVVAVGMELKGLEGKMDLWDKRIEVLENGLRRLEMEEKKDVDGKKSVKAVL